MRSIIGVCLACAAVLFVSCKKDPHSPNPSHKDSTCELIQSLVFIDGLPEDGGGLFSQYRKELDGSGKVTKVVAAQYTLGLRDSVALLVRYNGTTVYLLDLKNPADTFSVATFDARHRLIKMTAGNVPEGRNTFLTSEFFYKDGRLSYYLIWDLFDFHLSYDANGNVTRIYREQDGTDKGIFFTYDLSVTATHQFYSDHFSTNGVSDAVDLAQFMGWLPDLNPINKRTAYIEVADEKPTFAAPGYVGEHPITGHVFDSNGNLVSYNGAYINIYNCKAKKNTHFN